MKRQVKHAGILISTSYVLSQGIRLLANLVVARLLAPEMFGLMAFVLMVQQGIVMFSDVGLNAYVVRHRHYRNQTMLDTIWTIQMLRGWLIWMLLLTFSFLLWFLQHHEITLNWGVINEQELPSLISVMGFTSLFAGYKSLAHLVYGRELNRLRIEIAELIAQFVGTVTMITWAYYFPSVWSLASAGFISSIVSLWLSYQLFDVRHKAEWNRKIVSEVSQFGKWIFIATALTFLAQQGDRLFLSVNISARELGLYSIAFMLAGFMTTFIDKMSAYLLLPVFSRYSDDIVNLKKNYYRLRSYQDTAISLFVVSGGMLAPDIIDVIYDERYGDVVWMLQLLLLSVFMLSIGAACQAVLIAIGETKVQMQVMSLKLFSLFILISLLYPLYGLKGVIIATVISGFIGLLPQYIKMKQRKIIKVSGELYIFPVIGFYVFMII